jgi:hypothetical protein
MNDELRDHLQLHLKWGNLEGEEDYAGLSLRPM